MIVGTCKPEYYCKMHGGLPGVRRVPMATATHIMHSQRAEIAQIVCKYKETRCVGVLHKLLSCHLQSDATCI